MTQGASPRSSKAMSIGRQSRVREVAVVDVVEPWMPGAARERSGRQAVEHRGWRLAPRSSAAACRPLRDLGGPGPGTSERPPARPLAAHDRQQRGQRARRQRRDQALQAEGERGRTARGRRRSRRTPRARPRAACRPPAPRAARAPQRDAEVEGGSNPLARQRDAVAGAVADEEHAVLGRRAQLVREPVALVADGLGVEPARHLLRRLLDVVARLVGADADAPLAAPRAPTTRSRSGPPSGRSRRRGRCRAPSCGWTSRPREMRASGGWTLAPGPSTRRQPSASTISGAVRSPRSVLHRLARRARRTLAISNRASRLLPQRRAQLAVVEARPAPRQPEARRAVRRVERHALELLPDRALDAHRVQPRRRRRAGGRRALADLVAVDHEHVGAAAGQLARHREAGEARAADQHVGALVERRALGAAQRRAAGHRAARRERSPARRGRARRRGGRARRRRPPRRGRGSAAYAAHGEPDARAHRRGRGGDRRLGDARTARGPAPPAAATSARSAGVAAAEVVGLERPGQVDAVHLPVLAHVADEVRELERLAEAARSRRGSARARRAAGP